MKFDTLNFVVAIFGLAIVLVANLWPVRDSIQQNGTGDPLHVEITTSYGFPKAAVLTRNDSPSTSIEFDWLGVVLNVVVGGIFVFLWSYSIREVINFAGRIRKRKDPSTHST